MKQTMAEYAREEALRKNDTKYAELLTARIDRYENEPNEGKKDLLKKAQTLEAARDEAKLHSPWLTFAGTGFQLAIVLLSASILAVSMSMFWGSIIVGGFASLLLSQGIWLWLPLTV
jgi:hypothetical protein